MNSYWLDTVPATARFSTLEGAHATDTVIIGGGITGLLAAYYLTRAGKQVTLLEKDTLASGETGYTTAFLMYVTDRYLTELHGQFGNEQTKKAWQCGKDAIDELERIAVQENISCEFARLPAYVYATNEDDWKKLKKEHMFAKELGFPLQLIEKHAPFSSLGALEIPHQGKFHPRKFLQGLIEAIARQGGQFFENSKVESFNALDPHIVHTANGSITAKQVVVATHVPIDNAFETPTRYYAKQSFVIRATVPSGTIPEGLYLDSLDPYHYLRVDRGTNEDALILGGEDVETGSPDATNERFAALETYLRHTLIPETPYTLTHRWSGQVIETADGLPYIGRSLANEDHFIATGYAGNGMTFGVVAGKLISDLILEQKNPYKDLFTPARLKGLGAIAGIGGHFAKEFVKGYATSFEDETKTIAPGQGKVIERGGEKIAVFRTPAGKLISYSALCTHLKCVVGWNESAKSWDCPCHGSRFDSEGHVINGPAIDDLPAVELPPLKG